MKGFFNLHMDEVLLYRVRDITLTRSFGQRLFGMGTVIVYSSDKTLPEFQLKNIRHSLWVKELIHEQVEEMKMQRRMRISEIMGDQDLSMDDYDDEDLDAFDSECEEEWMKPGFFTKLGFFLHRIHLIFVYVLLNLLANLL